MDLWLRVSHAKFLDKDSSWQAHAYHTEQQLPVVMVGLWPLSACERVGCWTRQLNHVCVPAYAVKRFNAHSKRWIDVQPQKHNQHTMHWEICCKAFICFGSKALNA